MGKSISLQLRDINIAHMHYLEQFSAYEVNRILGQLAKTEKAIKLKLQEYAGNSAWTVQRKQALLRDIKELQNVYHDKLEGVVLGDMVKIADAEIKFYADSLSKSITELGLGFDVVNPAPAKLFSTAVNSKIIFPDGESFSMNEMIKYFGAKHRATVNQVIKTGFLIGDTTDVMARKLYDNGGRGFATRRSAQTLVRTAVTHMSSEARQFTYRENSDLVKGYSWVSTLDKRTTPTCQSYDGGVFYYHDKERSTLPAGVLPPAHYNCRSTTVPIIKSWKELGINLKEAPIGTRSSLDGYIPQSVKYKEWLGSQPGSIQEEVLGAVRYDMFKKGKITIPQLYAPSGQMITLPQLQKKGFEISDEYLRYVKK